jgi:hypothetical protein
MKSLKIRRVLHRNYIETVQNCSRVFERAISVTKHRILRINSIDWKKCARIILLVFTERVFYLFLECAPID